MNKMVKRLLLFTVSVPAIVLIVLKLDHCNQLAINILVVIFSALGAVELSELIAPKKLIIGKAEAAALGAAAPAAMTLTVSFGLGFNGLLVPAVIAGAVSWLLASRIFSSGEKLENAINRIAAGFAVLLYPGILMAWIVRMGNWENAKYLILTFFCLVFAGDSAAWAAGKLFGRRNRGVIPASPKKSAAGFIAGIAAPMLIGTGAALYWPLMFEPRFAAALAELPAPLLAQAAGPVAGAVLGLLTAVAAALGDLGESVIKRSSGLKESGNIIPGRGGVLDSVDSLSLAAPVFYLAFRLLFN